MRDPYHITRLKNGLTVASVPMPHMTSVSLGIWVGVGSRYEAAEVSGICHFIEHLLFKGTKRRTALEISQAVEGVGGYLNAFTSEEATCFHARVSHERFSEVLDVLMDMLLDSKFAASEIAKEREVIKEEIAMYLDQPQHQVQELLNETLWPDQPLGRPITGTPGSLDNISRSMLLDFLHEKYVSGSLLIVAAGNISHQQVLESVSPYAARVSRGSRPTFTPAREIQETARLRLFTKKTEQTQLALAFRTCGRRDERRYVLRVLNTILGENMSSRLFQVVREDRGLAYSIYSSASHFDDTGDLVISAGLDADNLEKTLRLIVRELRRVRETVPGRAELRRAQDYLIGQIDLSLESTEHQMNWVGEQLLGFGRVYDPVETKAQLRAVSAAEVRQAAREFFRSDRMNLALVSPLKRADGLLKMRCDG